MPRCVVRLQADLDVDQIADYIGERNPTAGRKFILAVRKEFEFLSRWPRAGSERARVPKQLKGLRSWPVKGFRNYLILPNDDNIEIIRVLHGARDVDRIIIEI
jgi:toxin ParE1/3/4